MAIRRRAGTVSLRAAVPARPVIVRSGSMRARAGRPHIRCLGPARHRHPHRHETQRKPGGHDQAQPPHRPPSASGQVGEYLARRRWRGLPRGHRLSRWHAHLPRRDIRPSGHAVAFSFADFPPLSGKRWRADKRYIVLAGAPARGNPPLAALRLARGAAQVRAARVRAGLVRSRRPRCRSARAKRPGRLPERVLNPGVNTTDPEFPSTTAGGFGRDATPPACVQASALCPAAG